MMVATSVLAKLSTSVARSSLIAIIVAISIDAILTLLAAIQYPYLVDYYNDDLYISSSRTIAIVYSAIAIAALPLSVSTAVACYTNATNYILIHAGITGIFVPVSILVYFSTNSARYKASEYVEDYKQMIADYRISNDRIKIANDHSTVTGEDHHKTLVNHDSNEPKVRLSSFVNLIDSIQTKFSCCGVDSVKDWIKQWDDFIAPSCCKERETTINSHWAQKFNIDPNHQFKHCNESNSYNLGCLVALKDAEHSKYAWLSDLIIFMIVITIANTIVSLLLFGLSKTEDSDYEGDEHELSIVGVSAKPRPSQPTITSIKHRPSVVQTLSGGGENIITARAQAVRFNMGDSPLASTGGGSKFSAAARRGSSFI